MYFQWCEISCQPDLPFARILSGMVDLTVRTREYWMIFRGPAFLAVVWFGSSPIPWSPLSSARWLSFSVFLECCRSSLLAAGGGGSWWARSQIILARECLALYKSFNTFWLELNTCCNIGGNWSYKLCLVLIKCGKMFKGMVLSIELRDESTLLSISCELVLNLALAPSWV